MATVTVELPDPLKSWIEEKAEADGFQNAGAYVHELIRRDREASQAGLSVDELRALVRDAKAGGYSDKSLEEIFAEAKLALARPRG